MSMKWGNEYPATVTGRDYIEWQAKKRGITLPSLERIARMKAEEGSGTVPESDAGSITSALFLAVCFIGTILTGFAIVSAVIGAAGG